MSTKRILTGDRPTGKLHLGHYIGSLKNRVELQDDAECYFLIADIHTLTTQPHKQNIAKLHQNISDMVLDYLSVGIDPDKAHILVQSSIPETYELNTLLGMLASVPRLERIPSVKEMAAAANLRSNALWVTRIPRADGCRYPSDACPSGSCWRGQSGQYRNGPRTSPAFQPYVRRIFPIPEIKLKVP